MSGVHFATSGAEDHISEPLFILRHDFNIECGNLPIAVSLIGYQGFISEPLDAFNFKGQSASTALLMPIRRGRGSQAYWTPLAITGGRLLSRSGQIQAI